MRKKNRLRTLQYAVLALLLLFSLMDFYLFQESANNQQNQIDPDTMSLYIAGKMASSYGDVYNRSLAIKMTSVIYGNEKQDVSSFLYSPFAALLLAKLVIVDHQSFQNLFLKMRLLLLIASIFLLSYILIYKTRYIDYRAKREHFMLFLSLMLLGVTHLAPFKANLIYGQLNLLLLFMLVIAMLVMPKRQIVSGILTAVSITMKFSLSIIGLYYLLFRMKKALGAMVLTIIILFTGTFFYFGLGIHLDYLEKVIFPFLTGIHVPLVKVELSREINQSINGILSGILQNEVVKGFMGKRSMDLSPYLYGIFSLLFTNFLLFYTSWVIYKSRPFMEKRKYLAFLGFSLFIALIPLVSPVTYSQDMVILLIPFSLLLNEVIRKNDFISACILIVYVLLNYIEPVFIYDNLVKFVSLGYLKLAANLLLYRGNLRLLKNYSN